ncbi:hypothetical protein D5R93_07245 [Actinomyces lilanjuaniae]|uniref:Integrase catalytic domain-containing protein n=1 Tax=Actinomyces lilanjuaniae TaxID=2321394 RepID=A0ABN5PSZ6_9ACTO|nr:hypothetical protein D5R93_07245 [Actinomyces lilanjuaniae]
MVSVFRRLGPGRDWAGAWAESFNATLKNEKVHQMVYSTRKKAVSNIASRIDPRYNQVHLHSSTRPPAPNEDRDPVADSR